MEPLVHTDQALYKLLDSQSEAIILADRSGSAFFLNNRAQDLVNFDSKSLSVFDICPDLKIPDWKNWWKQDHILEIEKKIKPPTGSEIPVRIRTQVIKGIHAQPFMEITMRPVDHRSDANEILRQITEATSPVIGSDFFRSLALHLTSCLKTHYALISECANVAKTKVRTLVFIEKDEVLENFEYDLTGTPCEIVMTGETYYCESDLDKYFPKEIGIQSYFGVPILLSTGEICGHIAIYDTVPMVISQKKMDILTIFASRAGAEVERKYQDERLQEDKARFESLFEESPIPLWEADFSEVYQHLSHLYKNNHDLADFQNSPEKIQRCLEMVQNLGFNQAFLRLFKTETVEQFLLLQGRLFSQGLLSILGCAIKAFMAGDLKFSAETTALTSKNEKIHLATQWSVPNGFDKDLSKVIICLVDITKTKDAEQKLNNTLDELVKLKERLQQENVYLQEEIKLQHNFDEIVTGSEKFYKVLRQVEQVAATDATVLILGETGTGKELISRAIHGISKRGNRPLVKVNCATLPANLIESELFGHEKGAFTGALYQKTGRFELADAGTIFLDEIGELPLELQAKLLRVLQEGEFERLGSSKTRKVNVRVIAATNRNLQAAVSQGEFREDLFYRLNVFPIICPPLRERKEDIPPLVKHFCKKYESKIGKQINKIPSKVMRALRDYNWPGNIRELENIIERSIILSVDGQLTLEDWRIKKDHAPDDLKNPTLEDVQRRHILKTLEDTQWKVSGANGAARILGLKPTTLEARMKKMGIQRNKQ